MSDDVGFTELFGDACIRAHDYAKASSGRVDASGWFFPAKSLMSCFIASISSPGFCARRARAMSVSMASRRLPASHMACIRAHDYAKAVDTFYKLEYISEPGDTKARLKLGKALLANGDYSGADSILEAFSNDEDAINRRL